MSRVRLGDVAAEHKESCKDNKDGYPIVGLEHLIPEEITLSAWDNSSDNSFTKMFRKGNILFGRRRAYLKKAAIAPFDGICSSDITVIEAKPDRILPELLPFIIQNDALFDYAVSKSAGSLSPRVKWEHLKDYEFELPDMDEQRKLAEVLWAINDAKDAYKRLISATEELVKSRFIEMFGDLASPDCQWKAEKLIDTCTDPDDIKCGPFGTQLSKDEYRSCGIAVWEIPQINSGFATMPTHFLTEEKAQQLASYSIKPGDIAMSRKGNVGKCAVFPQQFEPGIIHSDVLRIRIDESRMLPVFMMHQLHFSEAVQHQIALVSSGAIMAGINVTKLKQIFVHLPPLELQKQFVAFVDQTEKSKYELEHTLTELITTYKRILSENLG